MSGRGETPARGGRWRRRLVALALALGLALLAAEAAARVRYGAPLRERLPILRIRANPGRGWEMLPGELHYTYLHPVRVNALGLRGEEVPPRSEAPDEVRVLALGDSLVYGQGVGDAETIPALLERELEARDPEGRGFRVVNGGHRAYDTAQELALLRELGERIDPDVVVLFWFWNDLQRTDVTALFRRLEASGPVAFDTKARMEGWPLVRWHALQLLRRSALVMAGADLWRARRAPPPPAGAYADGMRLLGRQLAELREIGAGLGALPLLCAVPDPNAVRGPHPTRALAEEACALARAAGVPALLLRDAVVRVAEETGRLPVLPYDGHYEPAANAAMARAAAELVLAELARGGE